MGCFFVDEEKKITNNDKQWLLYQNNAVAKLKRFFFLGPLIQLKLHQTVNVAAKNKTHFFLFSVCNFVLVNDYLQTDSIRNNSNNIYQNNYINRKDTNFGNFYQTSSDPRMETAIFRIPPPAAAAAPALRSCPASPLKDSIQETVAAQRTIHIKAGPDNWGRKEKQKQQKKNRNP